LNSSKYGVAFTPVCNTGQQGSHDKRTTYIGVSQKYNATSLFAEDATSVTQDPALPVHSRAPERKNGEMTLNCLKK
jgi:hypothetical protein